MRCLNCNKKITGNFPYNIFCNKKCVDDLTKSEISFNKIDLNGKEQIVLSTQSVAKFILLCTEKDLEHIWKKYNSKNWKNYNSKRRTPEDFEIFINVYQDTENFIQQYQIQILLQLSKYLNFSLMNEKQLYKINEKTTKNHERKEDRK